MVFAHPAGDEGKQRQPEQQVQVRPQDASADSPHRVKQVMVVVPVNPDIDETQHVAQKDRQQRLQGREVFAVRHFHLQHHDGNDDGQNAIAESFEPILSHSVARRLSPRLARYRRHQRWKCSYFDVLKGIGKTTRPGKQALQSTTRSVAFSAREPTFSGKIKRKSGVTLKIFRIERIIVIYGIFREILVK